MITGAATSAGTKAYAQRHVTLHYNELNGTGWSVSQAGFGCYRVGLGEDEHHLALKQALRAGVNLIDTSSNYWDGGSEQLVGTVLAELIAAGEIERESVVVVSKVGYLQGQNYKLSQERKREGRAFPDLVLYGQGLEHCLHPEFLADQLTRSLERLQMETLDGYLLHNPEYYLGWAKKSGLALAEARHEYERRIELAFRHLEQEVAQGRIQSYGISSNTFPSAATDYQFTSLERMWEIAESISPQHHFRVIQLPMNLFETGGATEQNQSEGRSVLEFAREKRLGVLINRPLNAFAGNVITRLAEVTAPGSERIEQISSLLEQLVAMEGTFKQSLLPKLGLTTAEQSKVADKIQAGTLLQQHWRSFSSFEHWMETTSQFLVPNVQTGIQMLSQRVNLPSKVDAWVEAYIDQVNAVLPAISDHYQVLAAQKTTEMKSQVAAVDADWGAASTLSQMALRALRTTAGITTVLVGMRLENYVQDVLTELQQDVEMGERKSSWQRMGER